MIRISREKKCDVRIAVTAIGYDRQRAAEALRVRKAHNSGCAVEVRSITFVRELVQKAVSVGRSRKVEARKKFAPEHREKTIGAKA